MQFISPLSWAGGKSKNIRHILKYFPQKIETYVEPFLGGASVGLRLLLDNRIKKVAILSDLNCDLINFWTAVKFGKVIDDYPTVNSEVEAKNIYNQIPKNGKLAWQFLYINRLSFSGMERAGFSKTRWDWKYYNCLDRVQTCEALLKNKTIILNSDYKFVINKYDNEDVLFYFDPPYFDVSKNIYVHEEFDYIEFAQILKKIKGKFILSLNDKEFVRNTFKGFYFFEEKWKWQMTNGRSKLGAKLGFELIITNFDPKIAEQLKLQF